MTWGALFSTIAGDITKGLIATGLSLGAGVLVAAAMGTAVVAIGPVIAAVAVGVGAGLLLDAIDRRVGFTDTLSRLCDQGLARLNRLMTQAGTEAQAAWARLERSRVVRDLSHDAHEWSSWINRQWHRAE